MSAASFDDAAQYLPGLSLESKTRLFADLQRLSELNYYLITDDDSRMQGDVVAESRYIAFAGDQPQLDTVRSMILSNSCDIDPGNARQTPQFITIAPLIKITQFEAMLTDGQIEPERIAQKVDSIRAQKMSSMFFLPRGNGVSEDSAVMFDQLQAVPIQTFEGWGTAPLGKLSQPAHWLLLLKLSIHFSRQYDETDRYALERQAATRPAP